MNHKGLTLLELILAMTILSFILVASGSLNLFVLRAANLNAEDAMLQNQLEYVLRDMDMHLTESNFDPGDTGGCVVLGAPANCLQVTDPDDKVIRYNYDPGTKTLERDIDGDNTPLSTGVLIPRPNSPAIFEIEPDSDNKLVRVNLAAQGEKYGKSFTIGGASKLFLFRGGNSAS